jgi:hypothetical protein
VLGVPFFFTNRFGEAEARMGADGVVRRATGAYVTGVSASAGTLPGDRAEPPVPEQLPVVLNRPFRSVAEMAYAWAGLPWTHLDLSIPEGGFGGLLDVFCVQENTHPKALEAGRVNLNTRHPAVIASVLFGARLDESGPRNILSSGSSGSVQRIAEALVARTSESDPRRGPLENIRDLSGRWRWGGDAGVGVVPLNGGFLYSGFAADFPVALADAQGVLRSERERNAILRALADAGGTRVWNLLIDVVVQSGRYPRSKPGSRVSGGQLLDAAARDAASQTELQRFTVEAQQRFWWHLAVDRLTGDVLDAVVEQVDP